LETFSLELEGRTLKLETGRLARQAGGSVLISYGGTVLLVTATMSDEPREGVDFFPLTVDYEERLYAVGRIPGGFIKREGRPTEKAILSARLTDRPLRPLFPEELRNSVHIVATVLSVDQNCPPEILSIIGASAALSISNIPFNGPIGAVMVGFIDGKPVINPDLEQSLQSSLHLTVAGTKDSVTMVEAGAQEISRPDLLACLGEGHKVIKQIVSLQEEMMAKVGRPKIEVPLFEPLPELAEQLEPFLRQRIDRALRTTEKLEREEKLAAVKEEAMEQFLEEYPEHEDEIKTIFENVLKETMRTMILQESVRTDGRKPDEIRPVSCEVAVLPRTHGSALFTRGQTQVLNVCTLGAPRDVQILDGLGIEESKRFMHHYNFPPYSVGEAGFMRGPGRREIGHGALAERALESVIPSEEEFPYTIRLVSEVLESNGSSSMASICAGSLSLMDAGIPVEKAVAGIAMGLIKEDENVAILSDIQGIEDFLGDMDFKVAGTGKGITALQMDIKTRGISLEILSRALEQAISGYRYILEIMKATIEGPRPELSPYAPRMITMQIDVDKIRDVIGPGGRVINKITDETGVEINVEPDGKVYILAVDLDAGSKAQKMIEELVVDVEPGQVYTGKVTRVEKYGAFIEVLPGKEGLLHISRMDHHHVDRTEDVVNLGDEVEVKVLDIDEKGRINLSRKALLPKPSQPPPRGKEKGRRQRPPQRSKQKP
jgi:polyribonucleotide nucleotidyltransferase